MFIVVIPAGFAADVRKGRPPEFQVNIDVTASMQASIGASCIQNIIGAEVARDATHSGAQPPSGVVLVIHRAFNPNGESSWIRAMAGLLDQPTMITIILTGAALIREREHGTIEHLMARPLTAFEITVDKVWADGLAAPTAAILSMCFGSRGWYTCRLRVPGCS